jgi:hypothetical protein
MPPSRCPKLATLVLTSFENITIFIASMFARRQALYANNREFVCKFTTEKVTYFRTLQNNMKFVC